MPGEGEQDCLLHHKFGDKLRNMAYSTFATVHSPISHHSCFPEVLLNYRRG